MKKAFFWFRRDLRLEDNHGLFQALSNQYEVVPVFIFDKAILSLLKDKSDRRVHFIHQTLIDIDEKIKSFGGSGLFVKYGETYAVWKKLIEEWSPDAIFCNHDYEPSAIKRDFNIETLAESCGVSFYSYKDQVIFEEEEILKADGSPYTVYTPYSKAWRKLFNPDMLEPKQSEKYLQHLTNASLPKIPTLGEIGFKETDLITPSTSVNTENIKNYSDLRDFPAADITSKMSIHLRFGTVSIRRLMKETMDLNGTFVSELIWREFFMMILWHFPASIKKEFKPKYAGIQWRHDEQDFKKWCFGKTGYPIVDAGMRELNATGFMHNRVRMITASFLVKHLMIDWRWGERYFAKKLLDYDLSANVGNWQWAAGTGCDAAPYFRIFNPYTQTEKFDKNLEYIKKWVPEFGTPSYPEAMIDHKVARERALRMYKEGIHE